MMQYRDDRMYVLRLSSDFYTSADNSITINGREFHLKDRNQPVALITYRNTFQLPPVRTDQFSTMDEAEIYIRKVEPTCPRASLGGMSPDPTPTWEEHLEWLRKSDLKSVLEGDNPIPEWAKY
jgi:hypothetical protein